MKSDQHTKQVVVVGGGFAGINFAKQLFKSKHYTVTVVDKNNYNYFTPLLYQVATGFLEPASISYPFRKFFKGKSQIRFRMASVTSVDTVTNTVYLDDGHTLSYDVLVFAAGAKTNYFGNAHLQQNAFALKTIDDAIFMRNQLIQNLEKASIEKDPVERKKLMTTVIGGGGPTGVELAGMLAEMKQYIIASDYPEINSDEMEIYIADAAPYLLGPMSDKSHEAAHDTLARMGVKIKLNVGIADYVEDVVTFSNGDTIPTKTLIWAAGVAANTFEGIAPESLGHGKRMLTDGFNRVKGYNDIYAIGDISIQFDDQEYPKGHPQLAQPAIQQGTLLGKNLIRQAKGQPMKPFKYFDRGDMAIIGRRHAVADLFKKKLHIGGLLGLIGWLGIHLLSLVNYNNRVKTLYNWMVAYLTRDQALRLIFRPEDKPDRVKQSPEPAYEKVKV